MANTRIMVLIHWQVEGIVEVFVDGSVTIGPGNHPGKRVIANAIDILRTISRATAY